MENTRRGIKMENLYSLSTPVVVVSGGGGGGVSGGGDSGVSGGGRIMAKW